MPQRYPAISTNKFLWVCILQRELLSSAWLFHKSFVYETMYKLMFFLVFLKNNDHELSKLNENNGRNFSPLCLPYWVGLLFRIACCRNAGVQMRLMRPSLCFFFKRITWFCFVSPRFKKNQL